MMDRISICKAWAKWNEIDPFLKWMVTGDEKWVTYENIVRKRSWSQSAVEQLKRYIYCQQLDRLKLAKWPEFANRRGVVFHQDNASRHTSVVTRQKLWELSWEVLMRPPYSPDLSPSDFYLFLELQNFLSDKELGSRDDCENGILEFFASKDQDFYERGIMKLPLKWQQIMQQNGANLTQIGQSETC
ncbi:histone-lysine N-methyltransferase SETMAR [Trichonephila clavipes]|nr:histone-lysine N-methyltransferase SETMAR [Trichonephila clavipes]